MRTISEKSLSDYMAEQLADEILSGRIKGGSRLRQEELAKTFHASRIPVREALQILEDQGLVVRLVTKRILVSEFDKEGIETIYQTICEIVKQAIRSILKNHKETLLQRKLVEDNYQFEWAIFECVENRYLSQLLKNGVDCYLRFALSIGGRLESIVAKRKVISNMLTVGEFEPVDMELTQYFEWLADIVNKEREKNQVHNF